MLSVITLAAVFAVSTAEAVGPVQAAWNNHATAFTHQNKTMILDDYTSTSTLEVHDFKTGNTRVFNGLTEIGVAFDELWAYMGNNSWGAPALQIKEAPTSAIFLMWYCEGAGIANATDTFDVVNGKIELQTLVLFPTADAVGLIQTAGGGSANSSTTGNALVFDHHFAAFVAKNLTANLEDYADDCIVNVFDVLTSEFKTYVGPQGINLIFTTFYTIDLPFEVQLQYTMQDHTFLGLTWNSTSANNGNGLWTDTFLYNSDGKFRVQNVVTGFPTSVDLPTPYADATQAPSESTTASPVSSPTSVATSGAAAQLAFSLPVIVTMMMVLIL